MGKNIQFLTDEEYEAIRRDIRTIIESIELSDSWVVIQNDEEIIAKLTAYVDQKIKLYY